MGRGQTRTQIYVCKKPLNQLVAGKNGQSGDKTQINTQMTQNNIYGNPRWNNWYKPTTQGDHDYQLYNGGIPGSSTAMTGNIRTNSGNKTQVTGNSGANH